MNIPRERSFYSNGIEKFLDEDTRLTLGTIVGNDKDGDSSGSQKAAWEEEIRILRKVLEPYRSKGGVFFEYKIPRMGRRIDAVALIEGVIFVIEFKVGEEKIKRADIEQTVDYALDLKYFHEGSHDRTIVPVLVATKVDELEKRLSCVVSKCSDDKVFEPLLSNEATLASLISECLKATNEARLDTEKWAMSGYSPTPTIIQAAKELYATHSVDAISRSDAVARSLEETCKRLYSIIDFCKAKNRKAICFVTGVPGAGKTLIGLNIANQKNRAEDEAEHAIYLSGNGPLVRVLTEALTRDSFEREKEKQKKGQKTEATRRVTKKQQESKVIKFIQPIHRYRDECLVDAELKGGEIVGKASIEHIAIFDEAQRAWTMEKLTKFMRDKGKYPNFPPYSEPEYLISCLNRHKDWAVVICLVGGGQEINEGEAGIAEWIRSLNKRFPAWHVYVSPNLSGKEYAEGEVEKLLSERQKETVHNEETSLHLSVPARSFRSEKLASFVHHLLAINEGDGVEENIAKAREIYAELKRNYPIYLTQSVEKAKEWLKEKTRGTERCGILASSDARRLKPLSVDVRSKTNVVHWFLDDRNDVRSSNALEDVATEFDVQGLEVDWACVVWDADFRYSKDGWKHYSFNGGTAWKNKKKKEDQDYQTNAYRVLLTRARQGMIIVVPHGDSEDSTRSPGFYKTTYNYLKNDIKLEEL